MNDKPLKIVFMGTPDFAVPALRHLIDGSHEVVAVYTQPPRPKGRGHKVQPSPVHQVAEEHNIPVFTPTRLKKNEKAQAEFAAHSADVAVVAAYGLILPTVILEAPRFGCLNIHASLLPRWRGASPIQHAIWKGDQESGVTIMQMEEGLDTGPMISKKVVTIRPQTTAQSLHDELAAMGAALITSTLNHLAAHGRIDAAPQDESQATYAPLLHKDDGKINWQQSNSEIDRQIRALNPWPGVWTVKADDSRIKILEAEVIPESFSAAPGILIDRMGHIACGGDTALRLIRVQPAGARSMDALSAINGGYISPDDQFF